ncbi:MAG: hypothetical protein PHE29_06415 [Tissierellia bacterium]|nr:hypothetical protein [Tissierellia bacterium]MDD4779594.1 hypothetical protein [Tissierellia bacterium]
MMIEKSKIIGFILSFIPGLSHLYIGLKERGFIFLGMLGAGFLGTIILEMMFYGGGQVFLLFMFGYAVLWLIALLDLLSAWRLAERRYYENMTMGNHETYYMSKEDINSSNKKSITLALSIIPGAGHMYLGYQRKGLLIMGAFFFSIFFMGWLGISLLLFLLPLIWFYSFFDAMHIVEGSYNETKEREIELPIIKHEWIGYGLIGIGIVIILERILYPLISYELRRYIQTSIVSLVLIVMGLVLLRNNKIENKEMEEDIEKNIIQDLDEIAEEGDHTEN